MTSTEDDIRLDDAGLREFNKLMDELPQHRWGGFITTTAAELREQVRLRGQLDQVGAAAAFAAAMRAVRVVH